MKFKLAATSILAVAILSATALAVQQGLSVKRMAKEGQTHKYKIEGDITLSFGTVTLSGIVQEKVTKVAANGDYDVESEQLEAKLFFQGQEQPSQIPPVTTTTYKANGEVVSVVGGEAGAESFRMANLGLLFDAGKALKVGDKWATEVKADTKTGAAAAKADFEVLAEEKVGEIDTIKVKSVVKETEGTEPAESESTYWLDKKDGWVVKAETSWKNAPFPNSPEKLNAKITLNRIN